jgi:hypothetical protein
MHRASLIILLTCLAGCGRQPEQQSAAPPEKPAAASPSVDSHETAKPPEKPFFVGRWASEEGNCQKLAWTITEQGLHTPGEVACQFHQATPTQRGYEVAATCTAEGPPQEWKIQFSYAQSARALLIEDAPFADIGLVRCDDSNASSVAASSGKDEAVSKGPEGATAVLSRYYELLKAGKFNDASKLWTPPDAGALKAAEQSVADYEGREVDIGEPGRIEGAAGSLYISIPVQIRAHRKSGEQVQLSGTATLRRVNDVPGATAEQLSWRIMQIDLQPAEKN